MRDEGYKFFGSGNIFEHTMLTRNNLIGVTMIHWNIALALDDYRWVSKVKWNKTSLY